MESRKRKNSHRLYQSYGNIAIFGIYASNEDQKLEIKDKFYESLSTIGNVGKKNFGDVNAQIGRQNNLDIVGRFGEESVNNNGPGLTVLCESHK